jgi:hypothetical protein
MLREKGRKRIRRLPRRYLRLDITSVAMHARLSAETAALAMHGDVHIYS